MGDQYMEYAIAVGERRPVSAQLLLALALCVVIGYLLGSVNWAIIVTRRFKNNEDIRSSGSGNAGMTNVLRTVGKVPAVLTFAGDFVKCVVAALAAVLVMWAFGLDGKAAGLPSVFDGLYVQLGKFFAGAACVLGHLFPVYFGFKGGKGIVTSSALMLMTDWRIFLLILLTFGLVFLWKRIISLGSVVCAALYPVYTFLFSFLHDYRGLGGSFLRLPGYSPRYQVCVMAIVVVLAALVLWKHRANIGRLLRGEEKPIRAKR